MNDLFNPSSALTMSSREIAQFVGSSHDSVLKTIRSLMERGIVFGNETPYTHEQNGQTYSEFRLDYRNTMVVVSGYSVEVRARIIDRWQELETAVAKPVELSRMDILKLAMESEQARIEAVSQRDEAVRTKAEIGSRREATAMATASAKSKEVAKLKHELGRNQQHATVIAVEKAAGRKFEKNAYVGLRRVTAEYGLKAVSVMDQRYGSVKAWPAVAWRQCFGIDLDALFPGGED